ncbi:MAG: MFS transporter [Planctomycetaceae bacterium]|nr:MFS transporter [Planctomycetaceae bacterium]
MTSSATPSSSAGSIKLRLSVMMFLQYFIWGAWFPLSFQYIPELGFSGVWLALIFGAFNIAAFTAMFFSTQFADRNFAAEKFVAFSHFVGGLAILGLFWVHGSAAAPASFVAFFSLLLLHCLFYVPTISITNSIAFANLKDPQHDFGPVRLWGTIGWIAASWPFIFILADWSKIPAFGSVPFVDWLSAALSTSKTGEALQQARSYTFIAAGISSLVLAAFSLGLPHTPPKPAAQAGNQLAWLEAMKLLRYPFLLVLFVVTFMDATIHQVFFHRVPDYLEKAVGIPGQWIMPVMSIGQIAEIGTMAILGYALKNLGWRRTMIFGILGHVARFTVFALYPHPGVAISINILHGICYAFYFATVYIFIDEFFPKDARSSAQGLFNFLILGLGPFVGNFLAGALMDMFKTADGGVDYHKLFLVPAGMGAVAAICLLLFFHPPKAGAPNDPRVATSEGADTPAL